MNKEKKKILIDNEGITLISLVVTIIVLLVLVRSVNFTINRR